MKELVLDELLKVKPDGRNELIFTTYENNSENNPDDLVLCGDYDDGLLCEEDQEVLFVESGIDLLVGTKEVSILVQNNKIYAVDNAFSKAGCSQIDQHLNFNTLREIRNLENTFAAPIVIGGIISQVYMDTDKERIAEAMYSNYSKDDFDSSEDDGRIFNGLLEEVESLYPEE